MHTLPTLTYDYDAFGSYVSKAIMELHHSKHHQTYVDKLNTALDTAPDLRELPLETLLSQLDTVPETIRSAIRNHGGGHYNHTLFWQCLSPQGGGEPDGTLGHSLTETYGTFQAFVDAFTEAATGVFGSGWVWLQPDLTITTTANQDSPIMAGQPAPILGLDVWEHAYYLDYTYKRIDYIKAWWHIVDWQQTAERYRLAQSQKSQ